MRMFLPQDITQEKISLTKEKHYGATEEELTKSEVRDFLVSVCVSEDFLSKEIKDFLGHTKAGKQLR